MLATCTITLINKTTVVHILINQLAKCVTTDLVLMEQLDGEKTDNFEVTFIEAMNTEVLKTVFGDSNVTEASGAITINVNNSAKANYIYVIDMLLKGNRAKRIVIPNGAISEVGETVYADDDVISYPVTITALADASGNTHYEYIAAA